MREKLNIQDHVNEAVSRVEDILNTSKDLKRIQKRQLIDACYCLRSHDLIGLTLIIGALSDNRSVDKHQSLIDLASSILEQFNSNEIPLARAEVLFLDLGYDRFFDLYGQISTAAFWEKEASYRFQKVTQVFAVYAELLQHKPFQDVLEWMSKYRPPMEAEISGAFFKFIRNILVHFPFFKQWDDVWISKELVNWNKENQSIDRFLKKFCGTAEIKYRYMIRGKKDFEYLSICMPKVYDDRKIYLKDIISEKQGVVFSLAMMLKILNTQIKEKPKGSGFNSCNHYLTRPKGDLEKNK